MLEQYLKDIGLGDKEAAVYLALLQADYVSPLELSRKINIKRATAYVVLKSLEKKGLVSETAVGKKVRFQAAPPERLGTYIGHEQVALAEKAKLLEEMIPQFKSIQKESGTKPVVKYYEGREGVIASGEMRYSSRKGGLKYGIYSRDLDDKFFTQKEREQLREKRMIAGAKSRSVYTYSKGILPEDPTCERVRVDEHRYPIFCDVDIYGDEVFINSLKKNIFSLYIKSPDFAETLKSLINYIIDSAKK
jgi:predicted transcriptional regulator